MNPDALLPRRTASLVKSEMQPDERIVWIGQPIPGRMARKSIAIVLFGSVFTAFSVFWILGAGFAAWKAPLLEAETQGPFAYFGLVFPLFGLPFVLAGLGMLSSPFWMYRNARRTAYVVTDRRALVFDAQGWSKMAIRSYKAERLSEMHRVQNSDGSGDIVLDQNTRTNSEGGKHSEDVGFLAVANVKEVEQTLRALASRAMDSNARARTP